MSDEEKIAEYWAGSVSYIMLNFRPALERTEMIELLHHYILLEKLSKE